MNQPDGSATRRVRELLEAEAERIAAPEVRAQTSDRLRRAGEKLIEVADKVLVDRNAVDGILTDPDVLFVVGVISVTRAATEAIFRATAEEDAESN